MTGAPGAPPERNRPLSTCWAGGKIFGYDSCQLRDGDKLNDVKINVGLKGCLDEISGEFYDNITYDHFVTPTIRLNVKLESIAD